jgi:channel protein (hemolysin III family)
VGLIQDDFVRSIPGFCQPVSSLSHLAAALVALIAAVPLIRLARGSRSRQMAVALYAVCVIAALGISGAYHSLDRGGAARLVMQHIDYIAIWLLIAGTFTAFHGIMCKGLWRGGMLAFIWSFAFAGVGLQIVAFDLFSGVLGLGIYLGLGWVGILSVFKLGRQIGFRAVRPIWFAGIAYSAGAVLEASGHPVLSRHWVGPHEMFHFAVITGVALHWVFIRRLLITHAPAIPVLLRSMRERSSAGALALPSHEPA